jgi:RNA polymerase sigma factor (sigma-70 family)
VPCRCRQDITLAFLPLARSLARPYRRAYPRHADDYSGAAALALVEAAATYDPGRGVSFARHASCRIAWALRDERRRLVRAARRPPCRPIREDRHPAADPDSRDEAAAILRRLGPRHAAVLRAIYLDGLTQADAAARLDLSQATVCRLHAEAIEFARAGVSSD